MKLRDGFEFVHSHIFWNLQRIRYVNDLSNIQHAKHAGEVKVAASRIIAKLQQLDSLYTIALACTLLGLPM